MFLSLSLSFASCTGRQRIVGGGRGFNADCISAKLDRTTHSIRWLSVGWFMTPAAHALQPVARSKQLNLDIYVRHHGNACTALQASVGNHTEHNWVIRPFYLAISTYHTDVSWTAEFCYQMSSCTVETNIHGYFVASRRPDFIILSIYDL